MVLYHKVLYTQEMPQKRTLYYALAVEAQQDTESRTSEEPQKYLPSVINLSWKNMR